MENSQFSPMSQLLNSLGLTREDLNKRSDQMRKFLTSDATPLPRVPDHDVFRKPSSGDSESTFKLGPVVSRTSARSSTRGRSSSIRDTTTPPPAPAGSPVKAEPNDGVIPPPTRYYDSMEMVIERQRQNRKEKRKKERVASGQHAPPSPTPSSSKPTSQIGVSLDLFMEARDDKRSETESTASSDDALPLIEPRPPVTPKKNNYYREHTHLGSATVRKRPTAREESPTPRARSQANYYGHHASSSNYLPQPFPEVGPSSLPGSPQHQHMELPSRQYMISPVPSSSPPPSSAPSSPGRCVVNLVSSPGPMGPAPLEEDYGDLPYTLPPGPYSPTKPDLSYAALVGQAILSSIEHRLTLQEIYDWITIVYPYFKRGETTWMNSIRHVLSTTVCFRKVPRERSIGRTQWAIWDEDFECFKGGGFRKHLCKDYINTVAKDKQGGPKGKGRSRKRTEDDEAPGETRKAKRTKREPGPPSDQSSTDAPPAVPIPLSSHPLFPPTRPSAHHQSYYDSCVSHQQTTQTIPADFIFPPLPAAAAINHIALSPIDEPLAEASTPITGPIKYETQTKSTSSSPSEAPPRSDSSSLPDLTPSHSSSSPPISSSEGSAKVKTEEINEPEVDLDRKDALVSKPTSYPRPGSLLTYHSPNDPHVKKLDKGKNKAIPGLAMPPSPTLGRRTLAKGPGKSSPPKSYPLDHGITPSALMNPIASSSSNLPIPTTPPTRKRNLPVDTHQQSGLQAQGAHTPMHGSFSIGGPTTPSNMGFSIGDGESPPFRTPLGGIGDSPFRTPGSRLIFDPHDPRMLLDEELNRIGAGQGESPGGLFGKGAGRLLYDSPGQFMNSPDKWTKWW